MRRYAEIRIASRRAVLLVVTVAVAGAWGANGLRESYKSPGFAPIAPDNPSIEFMRSFDGDNDSQLDKGEFLKASEAMFQLLDVSGDGKIDAEEAKRDPAALYGERVRWAGQTVERYDVDDDGKLSVEEAPFGATAFGRADVNKDGRVDRRELTQLAFEIAVVADALRMADSPSKAAGTFFRKYDKNRDRKITLDEFEWGENMFGQFDRDGNKWLDEQEVGWLPPLPRSPKWQAKEWLKERDQDGNGQLSVQESAETPERFHSADLNADGQLSLDEIAAAITQQMSWGKSGREKRVEMPAIGPSPGGVAKPPKLGPVAPGPGMVVAPVVKPTTPVLTVR